MPLHRQFFLTFRIVRVLRHCLNKSCQGVVSPSFGRLSLVMCQDSLGTRIGVLRHPLDYIQ
jgi:hypothetical protein